MSRQQIGLMALTLVAVARRVPPPLIGRPERAREAVFVAPFPSCPSCPLPQSLLDQLADHTREVRFAYRYAMRCELDFFCGFCQEVCPVEAIHLGVHYENAEYSRERWVYDLERLCEIDHPYTALWDPADPLSE